VVGLVDFLNAAQGLFDRKTVAIDFVVFADDLRNGAQATGHSDGTYVGVCGQPAVEHFRVQLIRFPVYVQIGSWKMRSQKRGAKRYHMGEEVIDIGIFGPADRIFVQS
jgi:hypothetical protein